MDSNISKRTFIRNCLLCGVGLAFLDPFGSAIKAASVTPPGLPDFKSSKDLWKWSREAIHYISTPRGLKCKLCPQNCEIEEREYGDCRTRIHLDSKLYTISYGNPCAVHVDPIEKKPLYHFLPASRAYSIATAGCNLACLNCQNWQISQSSPTDTRNYDLMPERVVKEAINKNCKSIAYTYSDPVAFYEYTLETSRLAHLQGIKNLIISAGYINEQPLRELIPYLDGANIDLKSFDNEIYEMLNAGTLQPVLDTLKILKEEGIWLEITNLIVPNWSDNLDMVKKMCNWLADEGFEDTPLHFSRFHPTYKLTNIPQTPLSTLERAASIAKQSGLKYVYIGNVPSHPSENTYCPGCEKIAIERKGFFIKSLNIENSACKYCGETISGVWD
jgi:pyruvate formate lyase activating enzyme